MTPSLSASQKNLGGSSKTLPLIIALFIGFGVATSVFAIRTKVLAGETVEVLAERYYGDAAKASVIRAANKIAEGEQPPAGKRVSIPSPTIHTVDRGERLGDIAELFLVGEGAEELLAEANGLNRGAKLKPGEVLTVFAEVQVKTNGASAEDLATSLLGDAALGARIRRYNGLADGGALPAEVYVPLVGLEINPNPPRGIAPPPPKEKPVATTAESTPAEVVETTPTKSEHTTDKPAPKPVEKKAEAPTPKPEEAPSTVMLPGAEKIDLSVPVTGKMATLKGFTHAMHTSMTVAGQKLSCLACHSYKSASSAEVVPPREGQCLICHRQSEPMPPRLRKGKSEKLALYTDHAIHLGPEGNAEKLMGRKITCRDCHAPIKEALTGMSTGGHASCVTCHQPGKVDPPVLGDSGGKHCLACHGDVEQIDVRGARTRYLRAHLVRPSGRTGDTFFNHQSHLAFAKGGGDVEGAPKIECRACHADMEDVGRGDRAAMVKMAGCVECHRQANRVGLPAPNDCKGCHLHLRHGLMPQNDVSQRKPLNHTAFFRRHHARAAAEQAPLCATCHAGVDPTDGNRCDTCHRVMRPRDHTAGFRDRVHGRMAQIDSARCATCHRAERCEGCHRMTPKSHFPIGRFVDGGAHGIRARLDLGACLTCHRFEISCSRCHSATP